MLRITFKILGIILIVFFGVPAFSSADVVITEIMYDLPGDDRSREWIEIYNNGLNEVDVLVGGGSSSWRLSDGSQHTLTLAKGLSKLAPNSYAVIVDSPIRFSAEWPNFNGTVFDSSMALNNIFGDLSLLSSKNGQVVNRVSYYSTQGADGDGNSLQLQEGGVWVAAVPTPGMRNTNQVAVSNSQTSNSDASKLSAHYGSINTSRGFSTPTLSVGVGRERVTAFGSPMEFKAETNLDVTKYNTFVWNFGDGSQGGGSVVSHTYQYPGNHVVVLGASFQEGNAIARVNVKVVDPEFSVLSADSNQITIKNNSAYEVSLFGRALVSGDKFFVFLKDTIISPLQALTFGSNVTGLSPASSTDVFIAVLGDAEQPKFNEKINDQRNKQIQYIKNQIESLQTKMREMFNLK